MEHILTKRAVIEYSNIERSRIILRKEIFIKQVELLISEHEEKGIEYIYDNQRIVACKIVSEFTDREKIVVMALALTQSGKTGTMCAFIKKLLEDTDKKNIIPIDNIFIITGHSSREWKEQTKDSLPESIQKHVYHRGDLTKEFLEELKEKQNIIIIIDEIQIAAKKDQTIFKTFKEAGFLDKQFLYKNDIKILEFTATPDGTIYDLLNWNQSSVKIIAKVGEGYTSCFDLLTSGRVKQYKNLCGYDKETGLIDPKTIENIEELKDDIFSFERPLYHIIRTKTGAEQERTIENFRYVFDPDSIDMIKYDRESEINDINKTLSRAPAKHTIIFIKEMLRCSKRLKKRNLGVLYERWTGNPDDSTIIQGLIGRATGYDDNGFSIVYTNTESIEKYFLLWESDFGDKTVEWKSKTTTFKNGSISGKNTFNDSKQYKGFEEGDLLVQEEEEEHRREPIIERFNTFEEAKIFYTHILKPRFGGKGPNKRKLNENGFYESCSSRIKKVRTIEEIINIRKWGLNESHKYVVHPCYENIEDKDTLKWLVIYY